MSNSFGSGAMMTGGFWVWLLVCVGFVFLLLIIVGVMFVFFGLIRRKTPAPHKPAESPLDILNRRYAAGEIDKKDFEIRKKDLEG